MAQFELHRNLESSKKGDGESASAIGRKIISKIKLTVDPVNIGKPFSQTSVSSDFMIP